MLVKLHSKEFRNIWWMELYYTDCAVKLSVFPLPLKMFGWESADACLPVFVTFLFYQHGFASCQHYKMDIGHTSRRATVYGLITVTIKCDCYCCHCCWTTEIKWKIVLWQSKTRAKRLQYTHKWQGWDGDRVCVCICMFTYEADVRRGWIDTEIKANLSENLVSRIKKFQREI